MAWILLVGGLAALFGFARARLHRLEWLLWGLLLLGVGFTQIQDKANTPRLPDFAQPHPDANTSGTTLGGGFSYKDLAWLEEKGKRYIAGQFINNYSGERTDLYAEFEVFDAAGNSLGVLSQHVRKLQPKQEAQFKLEVPFPNANRFKFLRFSF